MKRVRFFFLMVSMFQLILLQAKNPYPNSIYNLSIGLGPNYGLRGTRSVLGYKNSGLLFELGYSHGILHTGWGGQLSLRWFYINFNYGSIGTMDMNDGSKKRIPAYIFGLGGMLNLGKAKKWFVDYTLHFFEVDGTYEEYNIFFDDFTPAIMASFGLGYRFEFKKFNEKLWLLMN